MDNLRFVDNLDGESAVALGLPASRLCLAALGAIMAWVLADLPLPAPLRLSAAGLVAVATIILVWGKVHGVPIARWAWLALGYATRLALAGSENTDHRVDLESLP
ncbi:MAG: hypothetical protein WBA31_01195 [Candidatus Dormiibacterota bacterium]